MISKKALPKEVIKHWPEVFGEINLKVIPLKYLDCLVVTFKDGKSWRIPVYSKIKKDNLAKIENELAEFFSSYQNSIDQIDFKLDTDRIKKDISKITGKFLKKRHL